MLCRFSRESLLTVMVLFTASSLSLVPLALPRKLLVNSHTHCPALTVHDLEDTYATETHLPVELIFVPARTELVFASHSLPR